MSFPLVRTEVSSLDALARELTARHSPSYPADSPFASARAVVIPAALFEAASLPQQIVLRNLLSVHRCTCRVDPALREGIWVEPAA